MSEKTNKLPIPLETCSVWIDNDGYLWHQDAPKKSKRVNVIILDVKEYTALITAYNGLYKAAKSVEPAMSSLMDELAKKKATNWGLVNNCLIDILQAVKKSEG